MEEAWGDWETGRLRIQGGQLLGLRHFLAHTASNPYTVGILLRIPCFLNIPGVMRDCEGSASLAAGNLRQGEHTLFVVWCISIALLGFEAVFLLFFV